MRQLAVALVAFGAAVVFADGQQEATGKGKHHVEATLALALVRGRWELAVGGQLMGWALLVLGHSVTRRPELMYAFPSALLLEPVMVIAQALERVGLRPGFVARGRHIARQALSS